MRSSATVVALPSPRRSPAQTVPELAAVERVFAAGRWVGRRASRRARERALGVLRASIAGEDAARMAVITYAREAICTVAVELVTRPAQARELVAELERSLRLSPLDLAREVLRSPELVDLPPAVAAEVQLGLLAVFAPLREVSLWTRDETGRTRCVHWVGPEPPAAGARACVERLLTGEVEQATRRQSFIGLPVVRWGRPVAALVARPERGARDRCRAFLTEAVPIFVFVLERDDLLARSAASERALLGPAERRLSGLGLDLHDGPLQDLALLGEDLRMLRSQLGSRLAETKELRIVNASLDDIEARLAALEADLRRVSTSLQSPSLLRQSFGAAVRSVVDGAAKRHGIGIRLRLRGDLTMLGGTTELALLAVIREALNNARLHGRASEVEVSVAAHRDRIEAEVRDNGRGFDVERTLVRAARSGHLGLAGLHERVRLLGGRARVDSAPGGPTSIAVVVPREAPVSGGNANG